MLKRICIREECEIEFEVVKSSDKKKFCSRSCAGIVNNAKHPKRTLQGSCKICSVKISSSRTYCDVHRNTSVRTTNEVTVVSCTVCSSFFSTTILDKLFCSKTCYSRNYDKVYRVRESNTCSRCGTSISYNSNSCKKCYPIIKFEEKVDSWLSGVWDGSSGKSRDLSDTIRLYLLEESNYTCSTESCRFNTPHPSDGRSVLEVDHINGDGYDHSPINLRVLCPNCHALTPTYKARNKGKGREVYYLRVDKRVNS